MFERSLVNVNVERGLAFTFTRGIPYVASILFTPLTLFRPGRVWSPPSLKSWITSKPLKLWAPNLASFPNNYLETFKVVVTCTSALTLPCQPNFKSHIFQNLLFYSFNYTLTLNLVMFYQIYYTCLCNPAFLATDLRRKHEFKMAQWQILVFNF